MTENRRTPCATCGACCRSYLVPVFGYDVWLIATRQRLSPEQFLVLFPPAEPTAICFRLEGDGAQFALALDKQGPFKAAQPCVFLMQLAGDETRCGIYADRPVVCQTYPMSMWGGAVVQRPDALCPPGSWTEADAMQPAWRDGLQRLRKHWDVYAEVVGRWNARVAAAPRGRSFLPPEFFSYLLNVYDRLAALDAEVGTERLARVHAGWRQLPDAGDARGPVDADGALSWLWYLSRARQIIDSFYPELPPHPLQLQAIDPANPSTGWQLRLATDARAGGARAAEQAAHVDTRSATSAG